jgi:SAM-dependent methyltransferase
VNFSQSDYYQNYAGLKKSYLEAYDSYIPLKHRFFALNRLTKRTTFHSKRLLDLGCASGLHLLGLSHYGIIPYGIEINPWFFRDIHPLLKDNVIYGDAMMDTYLFADDSFDIVICSAHGTCAYPELPQLFSEIARVTIKGGILLLDLPQAPIDIGPNLMTDFRSYIRMLKNAGFKIQQLVQKQAVCSLVEKKRWEGASL